MALENIPVFRRQGDGAIVIASGGKIVVQTGGKIVPNSETQAVAIASATGNTAGNCQTTINLMLTAMRGVGICATS